MFRIIILFSVLLRFNEAPPKILSYTGEAHISLDVMHQNKKVAVIDARVEITLYGEQNKNKVFVPKYSKITRIDSRDITVEYDALNYFINNYKIELDKSTQFIAITASLAHKIDDRGYIPIFTDGYASLRFNQDSLMTFKIISESASVLRFDRLRGTKTYWNVQYQE